MVKNTRSKKAYKIGDYVCVTWVDATADQKARLSSLKHMTAGELLEETKTFGILAKEDKDAVLIHQESSSIECDWTAIPKGCIIKNGIKRIK